KLSGVSEQIVGVILILVGLWTLRIALRVKIHTHVHEHDGHRHAHIHLHRADEAIQTSIAQEGKRGSWPGREGGPGAVGDSHASHASRAHRHRHAPLWIGAVHVTAGSAHLWAILPALALPSPGAVTAYLLGYGAGTIGAMVAFTTLFGLVSARAGSGAPGLYRKFLGATGVCAVVVGLFWLVPR